MAKSLYRPIYLSISHSSSLFGSVRFYGRWMHRKPAKVLLPFETTANNNLKQETIIELAPDFVKRTTSKELSRESINQISDVARQIKEDNFKHLKNKKETLLKKRLFYLSQKKVYDDNNEIIYNKLNSNDARLSSIFVKLKSKKERTRSKQVYVEGWRLIVDGLEAKCDLRYILFSRIEDLNNVRSFLPKTGVEIFKVSYKEMELFSNVETCPGILGVFEMPSADKIRRLAKPIPLQFLCDNIRVPGNLGAILRAAAGVGCDKVLLSKGCVDIWDPKVIRSAAGAHFRLPIYPSLEWDEIPKHLPNNSSLFIADSNTDLPIHDQQDSELSQYSLVPVAPYYGVDFSTLEHITLIIGGETEGISEMSYRLGAAKNGLRLNIPMQKGVDSLNTGMAAAVIAFEIRKQLVQAASKRKLGLAVNS